MLRRRPLWMVRLRHLRHVQAAFNWMLNKGNGETAEIEFCLHLTYIFGRGSVILCTYMQACMHARGCGSLASKTASMAVATSPAP